MQRALNTAATGMSARQLTIDTIANNLANMTTTGFKRRRAEFQDLLYQTIRAAGARTTSSTTAPTPLEIGLGVRPVATSASFTQGTLQMTSNQLDIAIEGQGFFAIRQSNGGLGYTRAGNFKLDSQGNLVTNDGDALEPSITVPAEASLIQVGDDGTVTAVFADSGAVEEIGQIELTTFINPAGLQSLGRNLFQTTPASGDPIVLAPGQPGVGRLTQGFLEQSNVDVVQEFVDMILAQRGYEAVAKVLRTADEMYSTVNNATR